MLSKKRLAIITARGGSKRIPRKNIKLFFGKPIISYSIETALNAGCFDEVMVSTDDKEIAEVAVKVGAKVPFFRSSKNSDDFSGTSDVLVEVLESYEKMGVVFDQACCLYPTAPFITPSILNEGLQLMESTGAPSLMPVASFSSPIWRALRIQDGKLARVMPKYEDYRSQDLEPTYFDVGQFYWFDVKEFIKSKSLLNSDTVPLIIPPNLVQDIDTEEDWKEAEFKYQYMVSSKK